MIWFEHEPRELNIDTVRPDRTESILNSRDTIRYDTIRYNTIWTVSDRPTMQYIHVRQTPHSTYNPWFVLYFLGEYSVVRYDTTRYEPRAIQYNTNGKPRTVRYDTIRYDMVRTASDRPTIHTCTANPAQYIRSAVRTVFPRGVQYGTKGTATMPVANRKILFTIREILFYAPKFFTIWSAVCTVFPRIVLQISSSQTDHAPIIPWYLLMELAVSSLITPELIKIMCFMSWFPSRCEIFGHFRFASIIVFEHIWHETGGKYDNKIIKLILDYWKT
jgi:hypothetical protein